MSKGVLPPTRFKPAGVVEWVKFSPEPPSFIHPKKQTGRRLAGVKYEEKLQGHLKELYGDLYVASPWFRFGELGKTRDRWCQPDGLLFLPQEGLVIIVEAKLQHTSDAWWQTKWLYLPVLAKAFSCGGWSFGICEVVKWYDPAVVFPEKHRLKAAVVMVQSGDFGVHIWKP